MKGDCGSDDRRKKNGPHREEIAPEVEILGNKIGESAIAESVGVEERVVCNRGEDEESPSRDGKSPEGNIGISAKGFFDIEDIGSDGSKKAKEEEYGTHRFASHAVINPVIKAINIDQKSEEQDKNDMRNFVTEEQIKEQPQRGEENQKIKDEIEDIILRETQSFKSALGMGEEKRKEEDDP